MARYIKALFGLVISLITLYYFFQAVSPETLSTFWEQTYVIVISFFILAPVYVLRAFKSFLIVRRYNVGFLQSGAAQFTGIALNNVLPFRLGDVFRVGYLNQYLNIRLSIAVAAIIIERLLDLFVILALLLVFLVIFYLELVMQVISKHIFSILGSIAVLMLALMSACMSKVFFKKARGLLFRISNRSPVSAEDVPKLILFTFFQWSIEILLFGAVLSFLVLGSVQALAILSTFATNLVTLIPSAPGYIGTFEAAGILPFTALDFDHIGKAGVFVLISHSAIWLFSTALGCLSIVLLPKSMNLISRDII